MILAKTLLISSLFLLVSACATAPAPDEAEEVANREAAAESQRLFEEALREEERERAAAEREIAEQQAIREANNKAEAEARAEAEAQARSVEEEAQRQAALREYQQRNAEPAVDEKAQEVARVQARVAELREQIAANRSETENLERNNAALREAITAAEDLSKTLAAEQQKYSATDPANGQAADILAKTRIEELRAQIEKLKAQAAALSQAAP